MKTIHHAFGPLLIAVMAGCASRAGVVLHQPVGPGHPQTASRSRRQGELIVYSAPEAADPANAYQVSHTSYKILAPDGKLLRRIDNRCGSFYSQPVTVDLAPGQYEIEAQAVNAGRVIVPVLIEDGRTTVVDLDETQFPQDVPKDSPDWVRLPNGIVIGAAAEPAGSQMTVSK
ncbi:MAG: hypothetical protein U1F98_04685 [Verrucomicrobiota bacterium]